LEENPRVEGKTAISSKERNPYQGSGTSYPNLHNELYQAPNGSMHSDRKLDSKVLVGIEG